MNKCFCRKFKILFIRKIELREDEFEPIIEKPNELTLDASYALNYRSISMSVALRYMNRPQNPTNRPQRQSS